MFNEQKIQKFKLEQLAEAYKIIAKIEPKLKIYVNVKYSDGKILSFLIGRDMRDNSSKALIRFNKDNPLAFKSLKFKTNKTVKNNILKYGTPVEIVINPDNSELDFNK